MTFDLAAVHVETAARLVALLEHNAGANPVAIARVTAETLSLSNIVALHERIAAALGVSDGAGEPVEMTPR